ncbi:hypothetical protein P7D22_03410 [Lichenihabitans sp. Uapishka_5]|uniref:hypothetical protein n=1 Tax=Lichenihabitans sp. Uapishka_5 TaxID=3037302 RepID=UPI0029E82321|nr:hypothetical protein [Lichenihabitans sp. Uapishka_5]MDX7950226.1 hypothetical protein [Lichenihabitans sp. Uapishka_5]
MPDANFDASTYWIHNFWPAIPTAERTGFALRRLAQEVLWDGAAYPEYVISKARALTSGIGYTWFAGADLSGNRDTVLTVANPTVPQWLSGRAAIQRAWLIPMLGLAFVGTLRARRSPLGVATLAFTATFAGEILFIGEVQARYLIICLPAIAILGGLSIEQTSGEPERRLFRETAWGAAALLFVALLCLTTWEACRHFATRPWIVSAVLDGSCPTGQQQVVDDGHTLRIELPAGRDCAEASITLPTGTRGLKAFITDGQYPYRFDQTLPLPLDYEIKGASSVANNSLRAHVSWLDLSVKGVDSPPILGLLVRREQSRTSASQSLIIAYPQIEH